MSMDEEFKAHLAELLSFPPCRRCGKVPELVAYSSAIDPGMFQIVARCRCRNMVVEPKELKEAPAFLPGWIPTAHYRVLSSLRAKWDSEAALVIP